MRKPLEPPRALDRGDLSQAEGVDDAEASAHELQPRLLAERRIHHLFRRRVVHLGDGFVGGRVNERGIFPEFREVHLDLRCPGIIQVRRLLRRDTGLRGPILVKHRRSAENQAVHDPVLGGHGMRVDGCDVVGRAPRPAVVERLVVEVRNHLLQCCA